jgi:hypothetical protein
MLDQLGFWKSNCLLNTNLSIQFEQYDNGLSIKLEKCIIGQIIENEYRRILFKIYRA